MRWDVGDVAYIRPRNSLENVDRLFEVFKEHNLNFDSQYVMLEGDDGELIILFAIRSYRLLVICLHLKCRSKFDRL